MKDWLQGHRNIVFVAIIAIAIAGFIAGLNGSLPLMEDSAIYLNIAQSLVEGRGLINTVGPIDSSGRYYPILLPSVIAFFWHWWGRNLLLFKSVNIVFALLFIGFLFKWAEEFFNDRLLSIAVIMFMAVSWQIAMYAHAILTEIPYLFFQRPAFMHSCVTAGVRRH